MPKYDVFGHFNIIWGTFTTLLFNVKTAMHKRLPTEGKFSRFVICLECKSYLYIQSNFTIRHFTYISLFFYYIFQIGSAIYSSEVFHQIYFLVYETRIPWFSAVLGPGWFFGTCTTLFYFEVGSNRLSLFNVEEAIFNTRKTKLQNTFASLLPDCPNDFFNPIMRILEPE